MIARRPLLLGSLAAAIASPARAQGRPRKIGYLHPATLEAATAQYMRPVWQRLGYVEGETVLLRSAETDLGRIPALVDELIKWGAGVLILVGPHTVKFGHQQVRNVPIVAVDLESDPVREGYARSYARPGGNITGLFMDFPDLAAKWLQLVQECAPDIDRVVILWDPVTGPGQVEALKAAAGQLKVSVLVAEVRHPTESIAVLKGLPRHSRIGVIQLGTPAGSSPDRLLTQALIDLNLPSMFHLKRYVDAGGLMSYGPKLEVYFPRAVDMAQKILLGTAPGDIPIERPDRFDFVVNMRTAKAIGLTIPPSILLRADEVIE